MFEKINIKRLCRRGAEKKSSKRIVSTRLMRGFTLAELLVVIAVIGIVAGFTFSVVVNPDEFILEGEARKVASEIRKVQALSLKSQQLQTPNRGYSFVPVGGYGIGFVEGYSGMQTFVDCFDAVNGNPPNGMFDANWPDPPHCQVEAPGGGSDCSTDIDCFYESAISETILLDDAVEVFEIQLDGNTLDGNGDEIIQASVVYRPPLPKVFFSAYNTYTEGEEGHELLIKLRLVEEPAEIRTVVVNQSGIVSVE